MADILVLNYQEIIKEEGKKHFNLTNAVTLGQFRSHLAVIHDLKIPLLDVLNQTALRQGVDKKILLTFSGGHKSDVFYVMPELIFQGATAIFFQLY